ncbi:hypothetical protein Emed_002617 [Eimeria media]
MDETADVPYEGVVSWLLCRRLLPEDYHQRLKGMTAYIREALQQQQQQQTEDPEVLAFLEEKKGGPFGYSEVEKLVELLAKNKATDGLFSKAFGSASYRQWRRLQKTFQQQNLHLADVSRALCSAANGLVPSHQKNLQQKQRLISDCIKRQQQLQETATAAQESYQQLCLNYGLQQETAGDPQLLQQQLQVYVHRKLPLRLQRAEQLLQQPGADLLSFYRSFISFSAGSLNKQEEEGQAPLPLLALLSVKGNMSLEEAAAAAPGISLLQQQLQQQQQQQQEAAKALEIEIQQQGDEGATEDPKQSQVDEAVCWVVEEGVNDSSSSSSSSSNSSSSSSKGLNESVLSNGVIRRQLLLELTELNAFLYSRILQSGGAANGSGNRKQQQQQQQQWQQNAFLPQELQKEENTRSLRCWVAAAVAAAAVVAAACFLAAAAVSAAVVAAACFLTAAAIAAAAIVGAAAALLGWRDSLEELQELLGGAETLQLLQLLQNDRAFNRVLRELLTARALVQKPLSAAKQQKSKQSALEGEVTAAAAALDKQRRDLQELHRLLQDRMTTAVGRKVRITGLPRDRLP